MEIYQDRLQLPFQFDAHLMQQDLLKLQQTSTWIDHFVTQNYEGNWSVIPLRGPKGAQHPVMMIYSDPSCNEFENTPFLASSPYFQMVLAHFKCELEAARLMKLSKGSAIKEHRDHDLSFEDGVIRIHIPVITNPQVEFYLNNKQVVMEEGSCWYLRLSDPHRVTNFSEFDRVHLVIDMKVNHWLENIFEGLVKTKSMN